MKIPYATRYKTTLSQDEDNLAQQAYGKNAQPVLHTDKSPEALITANCKKREPISLFGAAWRMIRA